MASTVIGRERKAKVMLFPKVDARHSLLTSTDRLYAREVGGVLIDFETARSQRAVELLQAGHSAARSYHIQRARLSLSDAAELARKDRDGFVEAAASALLSIHMDSGAGPYSAQPHFLAEAVATLDYEIFVIEDEMYSREAKQEVAKPLLLPRLALLAALKENLVQFEIRERSQHLFSTRVMLDNHLMQSNWVPAENVARTGLQNAGKIFGWDHWWCAVMKVRLATALLRQQKTKEAQEQVRHASNIFSEWMDGNTTDAVYKFELDTLQTAQSDIAIVS